MKEICDCGNTATWVYMPGFSRKPDGTKPNSFLCNSCIDIHRGCSCNEYHIDLAKLYNEPSMESDTPKGDEGIDWKWVEEGVWTPIDETGREYPCCEFDYDKDGFDAER